ncbi:MAG: hypothetical protein RL516_540 [Bacteroidota bacterium]|jgi:hypothetical protein
MNFKSFVTSFIIVFGLTVLSGCGFIMNGLYGLKNVKPMDDKTILTYGNKFNIPQDKSYLLDSTYIQFVKNQDTSKYSSEINNHLQPLQALYFDENEKLISYHVNCYAGGFPNLEWNRNQVMDVFPPLQQAPVDSLVSLALIRDCIHSVVGDNVVDSTRYNNTVIVFWSRFMGRQTERFIQTVQQNASLSKGGIVNLIYVNTDNLFLGL